MESLHVKSDFHHLGKISLYRKFSEIFLKDFSLVQTVSIVVFIDDLVSLGSIKFHSNLFIHKVFLIIMFIHVSEIYL
jgi:hypothetical protein